MKPIAILPLLLLAVPPLASCQSPAPNPPAAPAVLVAPNAQCLAQLDDAARRLHGKAVTLAADAFTRNDSVALATVGQSAGGRMMRPGEFLRMRLGAQGCELQLDGPATGERERTVALPGCTCRALAGN